MILSLFLVGCGCPRDIKDGRGPERATAHRCAPRTCPRCPTASCGAVELRHAKRPAAPRKAVRPKEGLAKKLKALSYRLARERVDTALRYGWLVLQEQAVMGESCPRKLFFHLTVALSRGTVSVPEQSGRPQVVTGLVKRTRAASACIWKGLAGFRRLPKGGRVYVSAAKKRRIKQASGTRLVVLRRGRGKQVNVSFPHRSGRDKLVKRCLSKHLGSPGLLDANDWVTLSVLVNLRTTLLRRYRCPRPRASPR